jgi:hypothetical protein
VAQCGHDVFAHWAKLGQKLYLQARLQLIDGDGRPLKVCGKPHWPAGNPKALNAENSDLSVDQGTESLRSSLVGQYLDASILSKISYDFHCGLSHPRKAESDRTV